MYQGACVAKTQLQQPIDFAPAVSAAAVRCVLQFMLQDRSVLQYGFLQSGPVVSHLSGAANERWNALIT
jgi:hypothetical protein